MEYIKKLDICLAHLHDLIASFEEAKETKQLTDDFFSDSLEHLEQIKEVITEMERPEPTPAPVMERVEETIAKAIFPNFRKALSLNDHFRFQRDLFAGDASLMEQAINTIDASETYREAADYLRNRFDWDWDSDSAMAFDELLRKRFS